MGLVTRAVLRILHSFHLRTERAAKLFADAVVNASLCDAIVNGGGQAPCRKIHAGAGGKLRQVADLADTGTCGPHAVMKARVRRRAGVFTASRAVRYAMVGSPDRNYLWFLSRTPMLESSTFGRLQEKARDLGFDILRLKMTLQAVD